jgi:hypothetical protein
MENFNLLTLAQMSKGSSKKKEREREREGERGRERGRIPTYYYINLSFQKYLL